MPMLAKRVMPMLAKPPHGAKCNACGLCCISSLCPVAEAHFGIRPGPCPAIMPQANGAVLCGIMEDPARFAPDKVMRHGAAVVSSSTRMLNGAGQGCDCLNPNEFEDRDFSLFIFLAAVIDMTTDEGVFARKIWGI